MNQPMATLEFLRGKRKEQYILPDKGMRLWNGLDDQPAVENNWNGTITQPEWVIKAHNTRNGRCFILGTGPSLVQQTALLPRLKDEQTWTVNRAYRFADQLGFKPTHHIISEPGPVLDWGRCIHPVFEFPGALNRIAIHWFPCNIPGWLWCAKAGDDVQIRWQGFMGLGPTLPPLPSGWASPLTCAQLAAWLGYSEFYFLGIDTTQVGQAWDVERGRTAQERSIYSILECFERAAHQIKKAGRKIYDCTPGGRVNKEGVLEYIPLEEVLGAHHG